MVTLGKTSSDDQDESKKNKLKSILALKEGKFGKETVESSSESIVEDDSDADILQDESLQIVNKDFKLDSKEGILVIHNLPHGFYEYQMEKYFSQFGKVLHVRVSRNLKTFKSRGYAFVQFKLREVAEIVQKTMNGYIIFDNVLRCSLMNPEDVHDNIFHPSLMKRKKINHKARAIQGMSIPRTAKEKLLRVKRRLEREKEKRKRIKESGINYDFAPTRKLLSKSQLKTLSDVN